MYGSSDDLMENYDLIIVEKYTNCRPKFLVVQLYVLDVFSIQGVHYSEAGRFFFYKFFWADLS